MYFTGANVEIASTPVGICAERCALAPAVASFSRPDMPVIRAVAVSTDVSPPSSPCGMCRQFLREFLLPNCPVYMYGKDGAYVMMTIEQLLPMSFGAGDLKSNSKSKSKGGGSEEGKKEGTAEWLMDEYGSLQGQV